MHTLRGITSGPPSAARSVGPAMGAEGDHMGKSRIGPVGRLAVVGLAVTMTAAACGSSDDDDSASGGSGGDTPPASESRGFDGTTITVAGMGSGTNFAGADVGGQTRF
jgi:hypothetical protein